MSDESAIFGPNDLAKVAAAITRALEQHGPTSAIPHLKHGLEELEKRNLLASSDALHLVERILSANSLVLSRNGTEWTVVPTRTQPTHAREFASIDRRVRELMIEMDRAYSEAWGRNTVRASDLLAAQGRMTIVDRDLEHRMEQLGYRWRPEAREWFVPWWARLQRAVLPGLIVVGTVVMVVGVFLVPTTGAAAARVAYLSAAVSVSVAVLGPLWRWSRGRG